MAEVNVTRTPAPATPTPVFPMFGGEFFDPFGGLMRFSREMERMFHGGRGSSEKDWSPAIAVKRKSGNFCVTAELPGVKLENVKVRIENRNLILEGKREEETSEKRDGFFHSERFYGNFFRSIPLPEGVDTGNTTAEFRNGMLEVMMPAPAPVASTKEIPVRVM